MQIIKISPTPYGMEETKLYSVVPLFLAHNNAPTHLHRITHISVTGEPVQIYLTAAFLNKISAAVQPTARGGAMTHLRLSAFTAADSLKNSKGFISLHSIY